METYIQIILPIFITMTIGLFTWIIRKIFKMEGDVKSHTESIADLKTNQKEEIKEIKTKIDSMTDKLTELCVSFAEFTGYMKRCNEEKNQ